MEYTVFFNDWNIWKTYDFDKACEFLDKDARYFIMTEDSQIIKNEDDILGWRTALERAAAWKPEKYE